MRQDSTGHNMRMTVKGHYMTKAGQKQDKTGQDKTRQLGKDKGD